MTSVATKTCRKCGATKPLGDFHNNRSMADGKVIYCKPCWNVYMRLQAVRHRDRKNAQNAKYDREHAEERKVYRAAWRKANAERIKARNAAYREAHREELREKNRVYAEANKDKIRAKYRANPEPARQRAREWAAQNADRANARVIAWRAAHPEKHREYMRLGAARRRARRANLPAFIVTSKDVRRLLSAPCAVPGCECRDIQIDHVIPIVRGGSHGVGNFQPLCSCHNQSKGSRTWMEFRIYLAAKATA